MLGPLLQRFCGLTDLPTDRSVPFFQPSARPAAKDNSIWDSFSGCSSMGK